MYYTCTHTKFSPLLQLLKISCLEHFSTLVFEFHKELLRISEWPTIDRNEVVIIVFIIFMSVLIEFYSLCNTLNTLNLDNFCTARFWLSYKLRKIWIFLVIISFHSYFRNEILFVKKMNLESILRCLIFYWELWFQELNLFWFEDQVNSRILMCGGIKNCLDTKI